MVIVIIGKKQSWWCCLPAVWPWGASHCHPKTLSKMHHDGSKVPDFVWWYRLVVGNVAGQDSFISMWQSFFLRFHVNLSFLFSSSSLSTIAQGRCCDIFRIHHTRTIRIVSTSTCTLHFGQPRWKRCKTANPSIVAQQRAGLWFVLFFPKSVLFVILFCFAFEWLSFRVWSLLWTFKRPLLYC